MYYRATNTDTEEVLEFFTKQELYEFLDEIEAATGDSSKYDIRTIVPCRGCSGEDSTERTDAYNISTGYWCDECYEHNYPYRKDRYHNYLDYGEHMDD